MSEQPRMSDVAPTDSELKTVLLGDDADQGWVAALALSHGRSGREILIEATRDRRAVVRGNAARALRDHPDPGVVPALAALLGDEDAFVRETACVSLNSLGPAAAPTVDTLIAMLAVEPPSRDSASAAHALQGIGPAAERAIPALMEVIRRSLVAERDALDVYYAVEALQAIGAREPALVSLLASLLPTDNPALAVVVTETLGAMGPIAGEAIDALRGELHRADSHGAIVAAVALAKIETPAATIDFLVSKAVNGDEDERDLAILGLGELGARAAPAMPGLSSLLDDPDVGSLASQAIRAIQDEDGSGRHGADRQGP